MQEVKMKKKNIYKRRNKRLTVEAFANCGSPLDCNQKCHNDGMVYVTNFQSVLEALASGK